LQETGAEGEAVALIDGRPSVVIAGGGTAGHVFPGLALAGALRDRGHLVAFIGTDRGLESRLVPAEGFTFHAVTATPLVRHVSMAAARAPFAALAAMRTCRPLVRKARAVVGMGGYASVSAALAARREHVPVLLHEQNAVAGLANRALSRIARVVALSFADARDDFPRRVRTQLTGNPVREEILRVPEVREALAKEARQTLDMDEGRRTVVVFGGSQGALHLDRTAVGAARLLASRGDLQILLISGPAHLDMIRPGLPRGAEDGTSGVLVRLVGYLDRMDLAYASADLVVSRAGATTVAELTVCGLPALLVPYPYATARHQEANARALQRAGGASLLLDDQLSAETLAGRIVSLIDHDERLRAMAERSASFGRPDAAERLADLVDEIAS
jgi:UDP-N-acetylglucosamine--N-acetylmuramyl-(pentapeptide) pyrophosphoryl-undecaprenol N-acetylglucosamine transferase